MICAGCGLELPPAPHGEGDPRASTTAHAVNEHAALDSPGKAHDALTALDAIQTHVSELRHAILDGQRPTPEPITRLTRATDDLTRAITHQFGEPVEPIEHHTSATQPVTTPPVWPDHLDESRADEAPHPRQPTPTNTNAAGDVTKPVTKSRPAPATPRRRSRPPRPAPLELDTVRLERGDNHSGTWRVLAGDSAQPTLVGLLEPTYHGASTKRWSARTAPGWTLVPDGPWPTRKLALLHLLDNHQRAAGA
jgi:hypothetical protein